MLFSPLVRIPFGYYIGRKAAFLDPCLLRYNYTSLGGLFLISRTRGRSIRRVGLAPRGAFHVTKLENRDRAKYNVSKGQASLVD